MDESNNTSAFGNQRPKNRRFRNNYRNNYRNSTQQNNRNPNSNGYYSRYSEYANSNQYNGYGNYNNERNTVYYQRNNDWIDDNSGFNLRNNLNNRNTEFSRRQPNNDRRVEVSVLNNYNSFERNPVNSQRNNEWTRNNRYNNRNHRNTEVFSKRQQNHNTRIEKPKSNLNPNAKPFQKFTRNDQNVSLPACSSYQRSFSSTSESYPSQQIDNNQREKQFKEITAGTCECIICCEKIKVESAIWHCEHCFNIFHIHCIKKWSKSCLSKDVTWRCPTCQSEHNPEKTKITYECYCRKSREPEFKINTTPHSCGDLCSKPNRVNKHCPHLCTMLCHPGPCPPCEASLTAPCFCNKTSLSVKCSTAKTNLSCGEICERLLNCQVHKCTKTCHNEECGSCDKEALQNCYCGKVVDKSITCGLEDALISCKSICNKLLDCGNHYCQSVCHDGPCEECQLLPENLLVCACGRTQLKDLDIERVKCIEPIPVCDKICSKPRKHCSHICQEMCHRDDCKPCELTSNVRCRCKKTSLNLKCSKIADDFENNNGVVCSNVCKAKKECGIHRCNEQCCPARADVHYCSLICSKLLSCYKHRCEEMCHKGACPPCHNVSFDELHCACGSSVLYPPIPCGQPLPTCTNPCSRPQQCTEHPVQHPCHGDDVECTPCVVLTEKLCAGQHKTLYNIQCFHKNLTCGQKCGKKLQSCQHSCQSICHAGDCPSVCTQKCQIRRSDCSHPCNKPCHSNKPCVNEDDNSDTFVPCKQKLLITCNCQIRQTEITCSKKLEIKITIRSQINLNHPNNTDYVINQSTGEVMLCCNSECTKLARKKQLDEAFLGSDDTDRPTNNDNSNLRTNDNGSLYSSFIKDFAKSNPEFLKSIDKIFVDLIKKLQNENGKKAYHRFDNLNRSKRQFVHELAEQFMLTTKSFEKEPNRHLTVEAVKGYCKIPTVRLLSYMQKTYPIIMFKDNRRTIIRHCPNTLNTIGDLSFADKMKSIKDYKNNDD